MTSKSKTLDLGSTNAPHHTMKQPAGPFKPSLTVPELQSNINLQHPGLSASDKRRRSWGDDRERLVAVAHRDVLATPCLQMLYNDLYNITAARRGVFTGLPFSKSPPKYIIVFFPPSLQGLKPHPAPVILKGNLVPCHKLYERWTSASFMHE